jgi:hypothetical protein
MVRSLITVVLAAAACANGSSAPAGSRGSAAVVSPPQPTAPQPADAGTRPTMTKPTVNVASDQDLQVALLAAVADADKAGAGELTVRIAPGTYKHGLQLRAPSTPDKLRFVVEPSGPGAVVLGGGIAITGKSITLRGVVIDGAQTPGSAVSLQAFESLEITGLALVGVKVGSGGGERDALIDLVARARGATAKLRDVWIVDSAAGAGAVLRVPVNGPGRWASVELDNVALVGNRAAVGLDVRATDKLTVRTAFVAEPSLTGAWLQVGTFGAISIEHSVVAVRNELVDHLDSSDGTYPKVALASSELLGAKPGKMIDARDTKLGKLPARIDSKAAAASARAGSAPDVAALRSAL